MRNKKADSWKRLRLAALLAAAALILSGCYAPPSGVDASGNEFPEYPSHTAAAVQTAAQSVVTAAPRGDASVTPYTGGVIVLKGTATPAPTVITINTLVPEPTVAPATPVPVTPTPVPTPTSSTLRDGSQGDAVRELQRKLKKLGFYTGNIDGDFGKGTEAAVKRFQAQYGLTADGVAGARTLAALETAEATASPTDTPTPKPTAAPNYNENTRLQNGNSGTLVRKVQDRLIELGYLAGEANGKYNNATEAAVRAFQKRHTSVSDGVAGKETLDALFSSRARKTSTASGVVGVTLKYGDNNDIVKAIQTRLKSLGYYSGPVNGNFGPQTQEAVTTFQTLNGLKADGVAGGTTLEKMFDADALTYRLARGTATPKPTATPTPKPTAAPKYSADTFLKVGASGTLVKQMQLRLIELGYLAGEATGKFNNGTLLALMAYQKKHINYADGVAGTETLDALFYGTSRKVNTALGVVGVTLQYGDNSPAVKALQNRLDSLGYYNGAVNGDFGNNTLVGVTNFQSLNGLKADGIAGTSTLEAIFSPDAKTYSQVSGF